MGMYLALMVVAPVLALILVGLGLLSAFYYKNRTRGIRQVVIGLGVFAAAAILFTLGWGPHGFNYFEGLQELFFPFL